MLDLSVVADGETWSLRAGKPRDELSEYDRLVLHHGQSALAFELSRRHAVSAAELRLAGDLLEDLEHDRLDEREIARRIAAFGLDPRAEYAALLAVGTRPAGRDVRTAIARELDSRSVRYLSASRRDRAASSSPPTERTTPWRWHASSSKQLRYPRGGRPAGVGNGPRPQPAGGARGA